MMEKVIIKSIKEMPTKTGGKFWAVELNGNRKATIGQWDSQLADYIIKDVMPSGNYEVELELTIKGDYTNITDINMKSPTELNAEVIKVPVETQGLPSMPDADNLGANPIPKMFNRDKSIIAQVVLKEAAAMVRSQDNWRIDTLGENLCACVVELTGAYKVALKQLE